MASSPNPDTEFHQQRGGGTETRRLDKPKPELKPAPHLRGNADRMGSLKAERDAALAMAALAEKESPEPLRGLSRENSKEHALILSGPSM